MGPLTLPEDRAPVIIGIGTAFDFISGVKPRVLMRCGEID